MAKILVAGGQSRIITHGGAASVGWWDGNATIPVANVVEYVETPAIGRAYAGGTLSTAWTVSLRTTLSSVTGLTQYALDSATGRLIIGLSTTNNGFFTSAWNNITLFATGDHTYMLVSDGSSIQAYRDNSAVGSPVSSGNDIGGTTKWRAHNSQAGYDWVPAIRAAHVANIGLNSTQRAALHTAMMALA